MHVPEDILPSDPSILAANAVPEDEFLVVRRRADVNSLEDRVVHTVDRASNTAVDEPPGTRECCIQDERHDG